MPPLLIPRVVIVLVARVNAALSLSVYLLPQSGGIAPWFGFWVGNGSSSNVLEMNTAHGNSDVDAVDELTGTGNVWTNNNFGTTSGI